MFSLSSVHIFKFQKYILARTYSNLNHYTTSIYNFKIHTATTAAVTTMVELATDGDGDDDGDNNSDSTSNSNDCGNYIGGGIGEKRRQW